MSALDAGAQHDAKLVRAPVVAERDRRRIDSASVELRACDTAASQLWILDDDLVARRAEAPGDAEARPGRRDARVQGKNVAVPLKAEDS